MKRAQKPAMDKLAVQDEQRAAMQTQRQIGTGRLWAPTGEVASSGLGVVLAAQGPVFLGGGRSGTARCRAPFAVPTAPYKQQQ